MTHKRIFIIGFIVTSLLVLYYVVLGLTQNHGKFVYPIDDTYIHMAMAKNFSRHGVWGVTNYAFSSSTSAPLYTLLLSLLYFIFGVKVIFPFLLSAAFGYLTLYAVYRFAKQNLPAKVYALLNAMIIVFVPMHIQMISGMEHTLHLLFSYYIVLFSLEIIKGDTSAKNMWLLLLAITLGVLTRYETLFIAGCVSICFLIQRNYKNAALVLIAAVLPVCIYGYVSVMNGSFFFPNSILVKANTPELTAKEFIRFFYLNYYHLFSTPFIVSCIVLLLFTVYSVGNGGGFYKALNKYFLQLIILAVIIIHMNFAKTGWFFRYEAYLIFLTVFSLHPLLTYLFSTANDRVNEEKNLWPVLIVSLLMLPLLIRFGETFFTAQKAMNNTYSQQIRMAEFVKHYYPKNKIIANDIGAITYYNDVELFDLMGLATVDVITNKKQKEISFQRFIDSATSGKGYEVAMLYESWFKNDLPSHWVKAGAWNIKDNRVCGADTVSFYSTDSVYLLRLKNNLKEFSASADATTQVLIEK